jgi:hypothetical protein
MKAGKSIDNGDDDLADSVAIGDRVMRVGNGVEREGARIAAWAQLRLGPRPAFEG